MYNLIYNPSLAQLYNVLSSLTLNECPFLFVIHVIKFQFVLTEFVCILMCQNGPKV